MDGDREKIPKVLLLLVMLLEISAPKFCVVGLAALAALCLDLCDWVSQSGPLYNLKTAILGIPDISTTIIMTTIVAKTKTKTLKIYKNGNEGEFKIVNRDVKAFCSAELQEGKPEDRGNCDRNEMYEIERVTKRK